MPDRVLFGTDGVRGKANEYPMTAEIALALGRAAAVLLAREVTSPRVVVGRDTRRSGPMLENALAAGLASMGADVWRAGIISTPGVAYLTKSMRAQAGVVISASHNPFYDNGIKFFGPDGFKLPDDVEAQMEALALKDPQWRLAGPQEIGWDQGIPDVEGRYIVYLKEQFAQDVNLDGMRIVVDCANGANYRVAPQVLEELGAQVIPLGVNPNGTNINDGVGALYPDGMCREVLRAGADIGVAFDGDGDRAILCSKEGRIVDGDGIMAILASYFKMLGKLKGNAVVATVMSNLGLERFLEAHGIGLLRTKVGDRYVVQRMLESGCNVGGEQSGHIVLLDHSTTGDGLLVFLKVLEVVLKEGKDLEGLLKGMERYPQVSDSVPVTSKPPLEELPGVLEAVRSAEQRLGKEGRVLVRYSGTSQKLRIMIEGEDEDLIKELLETIVEAVRGSGIAAR